MKYDHIVRAVAAMPWAIQDTWLSIALDVLKLRAEGERLTQEEIEARLGGRSAHREPVEQGAVAIIPIYGAIIPRADMFSEMSGASSAQKLMGAIRAAAENPQIGSIVLDIDSPGGSTHMIPELAAEIRKAREAKPVIAVANTLAASAAYWLGSQADELVASPSAMVGSIGVFAVHADFSKQNEKLGVEFTYVHAGDYKVELNPNQPLSDEARAALQERIDAHYDMFVEDVARGRGVSRGTVLADFGQGRIVTAQAALRRGMVDRIDTLEGVIERLVGDDSEPRARAASHLPTPTFAEEAQSALRAATGLLARADALRRVTAAKREDLVSLRDAHAAIVDEINEALAQTTPHADVIANEAISFERLRASL